MALSPVVDRYFQAWIGRDSWHTGHPNDLEYFYKFVRAVSTYSKKPVGDDELRTLITEAAKGKIDPDQLAEKATHYVHLFRHLYDFTKTPFPDPLISRNNIHAYYMDLTFQFGYDRKEQIAEVMRQVWGDDWEKQLRS